MTTRRLALLLLHHARWVLPDDRIVWAQAMERESHHIVKDREALSWAFGCILAAYAARARSENFLIPRTARLLLAGWCLAMPFSFFYRISLFMLCPLFDNSECQAHINTVPFILHGIAAALYLLAAWRLFCNRGTAFFPYAAGFLLIMASQAYSEVLPEQRAVFSAVRDAYYYFNSEFRHFRFATHAYNEILTVLILPAMLGVAIWLMDRYSGRRDSGAAEVSR